jgi:iron(III) transport system permease protein
VLVGESPWWNYKRLVHGHVNSWSITTLLVALILIGPFISLVITASGDSKGLWSHLIQTVAPRYALNTLLLMIGVGIFSLLFGVMTAWIIARFEFRYSRIIQWALLLPATVPAYIIAYTYTDFLEYAGPVQSFLRNIFGWGSARDYWFPEIRSMGGAVLVMSSVLYPYIYLLARTAFRQTSRSYIEIAKIQRPSTAISIELALARPAIIAGLALVLMEVLSDFGTVEFFAVETLTLGIFNIWLGMNNLAAAAQIAGIAFIFILSLIMIEQKARKRQRFYDSSQKDDPVLPNSLSTGMSILCILVCLVPIILGFAIPVGVLLNFVIRGLATSDLETLLMVSINSVFLALFVSFTVISIASGMVITTTYKKQPFLRWLSIISSLGYAFPGAILAVGVVSFAGQIDSILEEILTNFSSTPFGGFLIGGTGLLIMACVVRFQAVGHGAIVSGVSRLSPNIFGASFLLGHGFSKTVFKLSPALLSKSMLAGGLLVFVDTMKELPMTLLLRPFNYETLATHVYQLAKDELLEESALAAIIIIVVGLGPVMLLNKYQRK